MNRKVVLSLLGLLFVQSAARADMIETKNEGIMNGKVLSQDEQQVRFKPAKGKVRVIAKTDVLLLEVEAAAPKKPLAETIKKKAEDLWKAAQKAPEFLKKDSDAVTGKFIGVVGKPLDRSAADAKSAALAGAFDDATRASASSINKVSTFNKEVLRQQNEAKDSASKHEETKGRFTSL